MERFLSNVLWVYQSRSSFRDCIYFSAVFYFMVFQHNKEHFSYIVLQLLLFATELSGLLSQSEVLVTVFPVSFQMKNFISGLWKHLDYFIIQHCLIIFTSHHK